MNTKPRVELPSTPLTFHRTVRFVHYAKGLGRYLPYLISVLSVNTMLWSSAVAETVRTKRLDVRFPVVIAAVGGLSILALLPYRLYLTRLLTSTGGNTGIRGAKVATTRWRRRWKKARRSSESLQEFCRSNRELFAMPSGRELALTEDELAEHLSQVLGSVPTAVDFVTYGQHTSQPLQGFDVGSAKRARTVVQRISATIVGRLLSREIPMVAMKEEFESGLRLIFLTDVGAGGKDHAYIWLSVGLDVSGTLITGDMQSICTYWFGRGLSQDGVFYRGDADKAKGLWRLAGMLILLVPPFCYVAAAITVTELWKEVISRQPSGTFLCNFPPDAGDSVDLALVGRSGSDLRPEPALQSRVDGMRNELTMEVHRAIGAFGSVVKV